VIRRHEGHTVLVGDQRISSQEMKEILLKRKRENALVTIIGWSLAGLAILAIVWILYSGDFRISSTGLRSKPGALSGIFN
jgi:hypothetical protein